MADLRRSLIRLLEKRRVEPSEWSGEDGNAVGRISREFLAGPGYTTVSVRQELPTAFDGAGLPFRICPSSRSPSSPGHRRQAGSCAGQNGPGPSGGSSRTLPGRPCRRCRVDPADEVSGAFPARVGSGSSGYFLLPGDLAPGSIIRVSCPVYPSTRLRISPAPCGVLIPAGDPGQFPVKVVVQVAVRIHESEFKNRLGESSFNTFDINHDGHLQCAPESMGIWRLAGG